ncbi:Cd(II)/Pb(II)-responsive transcriptional regulator [Pseudomonas sp. N040]|uniref:Cd(II)/Pb(II)-responsive transcriptional regulator n=1 Tax=Pseudomonas sp. N040 TaxID=2785325 RepID=UPI0018A28CD7|nr:Cd(II)/Pb(II)-responsive transcriptional regulator [Pseudomonas sp. N040]MBF7729150.1 Cd(II)/Pb(II)-responsive transcriptional regulator [Pseudomonas sp. N040]MBW7012790.1 Cd(II)/Pb(II)-responsive transcriptional regulator [Pseudomonas sp. N040]
MKIGELARLAHCPVETVRYYEREGLLAAPARNASNYRLYGSSHLERLSFIRNCRSLDMTLGEIRRLLTLQDNPGADCGGVDELVDEHIGHVQARIASLQALQQQLLELRQRCSSGRGVAQCGILQQLGSVAGNAAGDAEPSHVGKSHRHS